MLVIIGVFLFGMFFGYLIDSNLRQVYERETLNHTIIQMWHEKQKCEATNKRDCQIVYSYQPK